MKTRKTTTVTRPKPSTLLVALAALTLAGAPLMANETAIVTNTEPVYTGGGYATQARNATQATQARQATGYVSPYSPSSPYNPAASGNVQRAYPVNAGLIYTSPMNTTVNPRTTVTNTPVIKREAVQPTSYRLGSPVFTTRNAGLNTRVATQTEPMETLPATTTRTLAVGGNPLGFPVTNTRVGGLNTRVNSSVGTQIQPVETLPSTTKTPVATTTTSTSRSSNTTPTTGNSPKVTTPVATQTPTESQPSTTQTQTDTTSTQGSSTPAAVANSNPPATTSYTSSGSPCPKVNRHEVNNRIANNARSNAAGTARSLIAQSQPGYVYDYNYYNTATDELANRAAIGNQLAQGMTVTNTYVGGPEAPKTYYRVAGGDYPTTTIRSGGSGTTTTHSPPIPSYPPTVRPINAGELNDGLLGVEVSSGPRLIKYYLDQAAELRADAAGYRERAEQWRADAARARANAEASRERAKNAKTDENREFHEGQAETYDDLSDILEDSASGLDRSAANDDAAAESYEADAAQSASNYGQAVAEQAQRQARAAAQAAQAQAAREAEAARVEADRQARLDALIRQSQQQSQPSTTTQPRRDAGPRQPSQPDGRIPRPGREPRNETLRKLLR
jgi:hypothetical protein